MTFFSRLKDKISDYQHILATILNTWLKLTTINGQRKNINMNLVVMNY
jgi:hypothetical protein